MGKAVSPREPRTLAERFWSLARGMEVAGVHPDHRDRVAVVEHVLAILDALERGESGGQVSVHTISFLKMLRESELRGDLSYAAPEQIRGESMDERSLVFSVGVLLFERLTGRHPFGAEGNSSRRLARIQKGEFGSGVNFFPTVPPALRTVLMKAMGPFPEERFPSLKELRAQLELFVTQNRPKQVRLPGTSPPTDDFADRTRVTDMSPHIRREIVVAVKRARTSPPSAAKTARPAHPAAPRRDPVETAAGPPAVPSAPSPRASEPAQSASGVLTDIHGDTTKVNETFENEDITERMVRPRHGQSEENALSQRRLHLVPFGWAAMGASIASLLFLGLAWHGGLIFSTASPGRAQVPEAAGPSPLAATPRPSTPPAAAAPAVETVPAAAPQPAPASSPPSPRPKRAFFDARASGVRAARWLRGCFSPARLAGGAAFGLGILYGSGDGRPQKIFFSNSDELSPSERHCVFTTLRDQFAADPPPPEDRVVDYFLRVARHEVEAHLMGR